MPPVLTALIIEDEPRAQEILRNLLAAHFPEIQVIGWTPSVKASVEWLGEHTPDIIFMDVELQDGTSFQIFERTEIRSHVIMTTAYDNYAVKAFEVNSLDYLLKPIELDALRRAISRAKAAAADVPSHVEPELPPREKFLIRLNDRIVPVKTSQVAYFYSEAKNTFIVTEDGTSYVLDESLDTIERQLDADRFFRISRSCILSEDAIGSVSKLMGGRLRVEPAKKIHAYTDLTVSRARVDDFLDWLER